MLAENKKLIYFSVNKLEDMLGKGNVWYVRHYEAYFDKVYVVYLMGKGPREIKEGRATLISLGRGNGFFDILFAPFRLFKFAKKVKPTSYLTADIVFSWWTSFLVKLLLRAKIYLMPVCLPYEIYKNSGQSLSTSLPIWFEKIFIKFSFFSSYRIITGKNIKVFIAWLSSLKYAKDKLLIVDLIPEELPSFEFYEALKSHLPIIRPGNESIILYVGRLHREKMVKDLITMLPLIQKRDLKIRLKIIGDGPEKKNLEFLAEKMGIRNQIDFLGFRQGEELVSYYKNADVFVSTLTGTALREAGLCRLPVVVYNIDWVRSFLVNEENALLAESGNVEELAWQVVRVLTDKSLKEKIANNLHTLALEYWRPEKLTTALKQAFEFK